MSSSKKLWFTLNVNEEIDQVESMLKIITEIPTFFKDLKSVVKITNIIENYRNTLETLHLLKHELLKKRHLIYIFKRAGEYVAYEDIINITLKEIYDMKFNKYIEIINEALFIARKELEVKTTITNCAEYWANTTFLFNKIESVQKDSYIIENLELINTSAEDYLNMLMPYKKNRYAKLYETTIFEWEKILITMQSRLTQLADLQKKWIILQNTFKCGHIVKQYTIAKKSFDKANKSFHKLIKTLRIKPYVIQQCCQLINKHYIDNIYLNLEICLALLQDHINEKRNKFPRFYFLSDEELYAITDSFYKKSFDNMGRYLSKMFDNIESLQTIEFSDIIFIRGLTSTDKETFSFGLDVVEPTEIEQTFNEVVSKMKILGRQLTKKAIFDYGNSNDNSLSFMDDQSAITILIALRVWVVCDIELCFDLMLQVSLLYLIRKAIEKFANKSYKKGY